MRYRERGFLQAVDAHGVVFEDGKDADFVAVHALAYHLSRRGYFVGWFEHYPSNVANPQADLFRAAALSSAGKARLKELIESDDDGETV